MEFFLTMTDTIT